MEKKVKKKEENKIMNWLKENKKALIFGVVGIIIGVSIMGIMWPKRIATLKDGSQAIVSIKGTKITADDLYNELKNGGGLTALLNIIDDKLLDEMYDVETEAADYAKSQSEYYYGIYESYYGYSKEEFLSSNGFKDEEAFITYLKDDFVVQKYFKEYLEKKVTDKDIDKYYKDNVFGEKQVYLFSSQDKDNDLEKVRNSLKKGLTFKEITEKYKDVTTNELGKVNFVNAVDYGETLIEQFKKLKAGEYSKVLNTDEYGYTVVYVASSAKKPSKDEAKKDIITAITTDMSNKDEKLYYQAFIELREKNGMKFSDTEMEKEYNNYKKQYK